MRRLALAFALLAAFALTGCGTVRALAGPDPEVAKHRDTYREALAEAKGAHPERATEYDAAWTALARYLATDAASVLDGIGNVVAGLLSPAGLTGIGGLAAAVLTYLNGRKSKRAGDDAHDENAERIAALEAKLAASAAPPKS